MRRTIRRIVTSRAPRIEVRRGRCCGLASRCASSARVAEPVERIAKLAPSRGKPPRRSVEIAAGFENGGSVENEARRTVSRSTAIARAIRTAARCCTSDRSGTGTMSPACLACACPAVAQTAASVTSATARAREWPIMKPPRSSRLMLSGRPASPIARRAAPRRVSPLPGPAGPRRIGRALADGVVQSRRMGGEERVDVVAAALAAGAVHGLCLLGAGWTVSV